jgi:hypothetical protein
MTEPFFNRIPSDDPAREVVLQRVEDAHGDDLEALKVELAGMKSHVVAILEDRMLSAARTKTLFLLLMETMPTPNQLSGGATELLLARAATYASQKLFTIDEFEQVAATLIHGATFQEHPGTYSAQHAIQRMLTGSLRTMAGRKTLGQADLPVLDAALAKDVRKAQGQYGRDQNLLVSKEIVTTLSFPQTLKAILESEVLQPEPYHLVGTIKQIFRQNLLSAEYIKVALQVVDVDVFCQACRDAFVAQTSAKSINEFVAMFGEAQLLPEKFFKKMSGTVYAKQIPYHLKMLGDKDLNLDQLPAFTGFVLRNIETIYSSLTSSHKDMRCRLIELCGQNGMAARGLELEAKCWRSACSSRVPDGVSDAEVLPYLKRYAPSDYGIAMEVIERAGLMNADSLLKDLSPTIWADVLLMIDIEPKDKKELMKRYPKLRGMVLEDELGL